MDLQPGRESLAEMTTKEYLVNIMATIEDELKLFRSILMTRVELLKSSELSKHYEKIREIKNRSEELKNQIMEYLVRNSEILMYSGRYIEIVRTLDRIAQHVDGLAYRYVLLIENGLQVDSTILKTLAEMNEQSLYQLRNLVDALNILPVNARKALEYLENVVRAEDIVDSMFRKAVFEIYQKLSGQVPALMMTKDIVEYQEEVCDLLKEIGEEIRYLVLVRTLLK